MSGNPRSRGIPKAVFGAIELGAALFALVACGREAGPGTRLPQGDTLVRAARYDEALAQAKKVLERDDRSADAHRIAGEVYLDLGQVARAYHHLLAAQALAPARSEIRGELARVYLVTGNVDEARSHALSILDADAQSVVGAVLIGATATTPTQVDKAIHQLEAMRSRAGSDARLRIALASLYQRKDDVTKAVQFAAEAVAADSLSAEAHGILSTLYQKQGNASLAAQESKTAERLSPGASPASIRTAESYLLYGQRDQAKAALQTIVGRSSVTGLAGIRLLAEMALADSNVAVADEMSGRVLQKDSTDIDGLLEMGRVRLLQKKPKEAIPYFERAVATGPYVAPSRYYLGLALARANHPREAQVETEQALKLVDNYPEALTQFGDLNARADIPRATIGFAERLVKLNPRSLEARRVLGESLIGANRAPDADKVFRDAAKLYPDRLEPRYWLGVSLAKQGRKAEARSEFESVLRIAPDFAEAMAQLVYLDLADQQSESALARVNAQLRLVPQSAALYDLLGSVHLARNELAPATAAFEKAVQLNPRFARPRAQLANVYLMSQKTDLAISQGEAARQLDPQSVPALLAVGVAYQTKGDFARARQAYEGALAVDPNSTAAANDLAVLLSETSNDQQEAMRYALAALKFAPDDPHIKDTAGWILYKAGRYVDALTILRQSAQALPASPPVQFHYGMVAQKTGDTTEARRALSVAVNAKMDFPGKEDARKALSLMK